MQVGEACGGRFGGGEGVRDPGHDLRIGVHVRRRNVLGRADDDGDFARVAAGHALDFAEAHARRVADDAALGPAIGQADHGALPRHQHRQRLDFIEGDARMVAHAALGGPALGVVLHAVALEHLHAAVVHPHRHGNDQRPLAVADLGVDVGIEVHPLGHAIQLLAGHVPETEGSAHSGILRYFFWATGYARPRRDEKEIPRRCGARPRRLRKRFAPDSALDAARQSPMMPARL